MQHCTCLLRNQSSSRSRRRTTSARTTWASAPPAVQPAPGTAARGHTRLPVTVCGNRTSPTNGKRANYQYACSTAPGTAARPHTSQTPCHCPTVATVCLRQGQDTRQCDSQRTVPVNRGLKQK
eukprot:COSAG06_NODE_826_length_12064_cov_8.219975_2_plen_123_part_00